MGPSSHRLGVLGIFSWPTKTKTGVLGVFPLRRAIPISTREGGESCRQTLSGLLSGGSLLSSASTRRRSKVVELFGPDLASERALPGSLDGEMGRLQLLDGCVGHSLRAVLFSMHRLGVSCQQAHDKGISFRARIHVWIPAEEVAVEASYEWAAVGWPTRRLGGIYRCDETVATVYCAERSRCTRHDRNPIVVTLE